MAGALIFDLDGTLLDTLASLAAAFNQALSDLNCPAHDIDDYRHIIGDGARVAAIRALPENRQDDDAISQCIALFQQHYAAHWQEATIYAGVQELIETLDKEMPIAVLSNKDQAFTQQCCDYFFPGKFRLAVGYSEGVKHKPDPSGASLIASTLDTSLKDIWMIGDTSTDMKTATACGMTGVGVLWGFRDRAELEQNGSTHIIESPDELTRLLNL